MKYTKELLEKLSKNVFSIAELCRALDIPPCGGNYKTLNTKLKEFSIDVTHFTGQAWNRGRKSVQYSQAKPLELILVENSTYNSSRLRQRLIVTGIKEAKCECCNLTEWNGKPIPIELEHINGNNTDNRLDNLQILCPNCHAQTNTYRGKNILSFKNELRKHSYDNRDKKFLRADLIQMRYKKNNTKLLCGCGKEKSRTSLNCKECDSVIRMSKTKIQWPSLEELQKMVNDSSYLQVGKSLGVSDNAVRKHLQKRTTPSGETGQTQDT